MSDLDSLVSVDITVADKAPTRASFGTPLFCDYHTAWLDYVREYSEADDMLDDGFLTTSPLYLMAQKAKSQEPSVETFKIGRLATPYTQTVNIIPTVTTQGFEYEGFTVNGVSIPYTVGAAATVQVIVEAVEPLVEAVTDITSTEDNTKIQATSTAGKTLAYTWERGINVIDVTPDPGISADLALIAAEDDDWYGLALVPNSDAIVKGAAGWLEAKSKQFVAQSGDWDIIDAGQTSDLASDLKALSYNRTGLIWHRYIGGTEWANAAWLSVMLAADPGSATPAFKTLSGITADDLRTGEISAIEAKNASWYGPRHGINITFEGKAASGRFMDVTRFVDWLKETIQVDIFTLLVNAPKLPFSQNGLNAIGMAIEGAIGKGATAGGIDTDQPYSVDTPLISAVSTADKAARRARTFKFRCVLTGALHGVTVDGTVSV